MPKGRNKIKKPPERVVFVEKYLILNVFVLALHFGEISSRITMYIIV